MRFLITAGPTREPIDQVRFISNRSSGRVGVSLAQAAADAGHEVTLLLGPVMVHGDVYGRCDVHRFTTAAELEALLAQHFPACDVLLMAAAVADYRPFKVQSGKQARGASPLTIRLEPTKDLVAQAASGKRPTQKIIAFALEEEAHLETRALEKMRRKGVDAIIANPLSTMESEHISPTLLTVDGGRESPGAMSKREFARWLIDQVERL